MANKLKPHRAARLKSEQKAWTVRAAGVAIFSVLTVFVVRIGGTVNLSIEIPNVATIDLVVSPPNR